MEEDGDALADQFDVDVVGAEDGWDEGENDAVDDEDDNEGDDEDDNEDDEDDDEEDDEDDDEDDEDNEDNDEDSDENENGDEEEAADRKRAKKQARAAASQKQPGTRPQIIRVVPASEHITSDKLSQLELAAVLSTRTAQIAQSGKAFLPEGAEPASTSAQRALQELRAGMCPLVVQRVVSSPHGQQKYIEERPVRELLLPLDIDELQL